MSMSVDQSIVKISEKISKYADEVQNKAIEELNQTADEILEYIKNNAPRGSSASHLADSFVKTEVGNGVNKTIYISSKTKSQLVHLIELGFKHRNGKHVAARPFMRPAYETFTPTMLESIRKIINGG